MKQLPEDRAISANTIDVESQSEATTPSVIERIAGCRSMAEIDRNHY
jgi:hypothetical protein